MVAALAASAMLGGCLGPAAPFCEPNGAYGNWNQPSLYSALRNETVFHGDPVRWQGGVATGVPLEFDDPAFVAAHQGDAWLAFVTWWTPERHYLMRGQGAPSTDGGTVTQSVLLEGDRHAMADFDAQEAGVFLEALTTLDAEARASVVSAWLDPEGEQYGRLRTIIVNVTLDLPASHRAFAPDDWAVAVATVEDGPRAGAWHFAFERAHVTWSGDAGSGNAYLMAWSDGKTEWSYQSGDGPSSKDGFRRAVARDFEDLGVPPPTFAGFHHRGPNSCWFG